MNSSIKVSWSENNRILDVQYSEFSGGERHVQIGLLPEQPIQTVNIQANIRSSNDLMDYLLLENALFQHNPDIAINLEIPYLPYARQDRVCAVGQAFSMQLMAEMLRLRPKKSVTVWDCHSSVGSQLLDAINIESWQIIGNSPELVDVLQDTNTVLICPDKGAKPRSEAIARAFDLKQIVFCEKKRDPVSGKILETTVLTDDLSGKTAVITDDICDGGMTFIGIAQALRKIGCAHIVLYVTHGIFSKGLSVFEGLIDRIYTTDSFSHNMSQSSIKLTVINFKNINFKK
ncbi:ribose-phosphate diphosphokinase [Hydromonas duriensis]|uniref:Ribose-phosphate pyrophosphokinase n=1 Tax=Hydromonas duriensis TaxID=1527608 RepID=A0A4R6YAT6_9BURK|nr:ribose-phosphate diphosphokinase [Hydromonas duriensis]TDR32711.1 ribose-phosphate pyrophosphokinase [Hydromonas duriensis]